jgi:hypothetical protein
MRERVISVSGRMLRKGVAASVINSSAGQISELLISLSKTYHKLGGSLDTQRIVNGFAIVFH